MSEARKALGERIREIRRRHFGARGAAAFAERLGVSSDSYAEFERGQVPAGEVLVRMCEATGEDLQWLLTGVAARGTMVISGTRGRHQALLARVIEALERDPRRARPLEAFLDLLCREPEASPPPELPERAPRLIPVFEADELPPLLPESCADSAQPAAAARLALPAGGELLGLSEPATARADAPRRVRLMRLPIDGGARDFLSSDELCTWLPNALAVRLRDEAMRPMFEPGDLAVGSRDATPRLGEPALVRLVDTPAVQCRVWLGEDAAGVNLGRLTDGGHEHIDAGRLAWTFAALFRVARVA